MKKLSEAGKLYLSDYYILEEAKKDVYDFLEEILVQVTSEIKEKIDKFSDSNFKWYIEDYKSKKGIFFISTQAQKKFKFFRDEKVDIYISYTDIRECNKLTNPASIRIKSYSPKAAKHTEIEVKKLSLKLFNENIYEPQHIEINLNSVEESANIMIKHIIEMTTKLKLLIEELIKEDTL